MPTAQVRFDYTPFGSPVSQIAGLIIAGAGRAADDVVPFGSGFLASLDLAFTARHVIDDIFERFTGRRPADLVGRLSFGLQLGTADASGGLVKWDITDYHYSPTLDIVGLKIRLAKPLPSDRLLHLPTFNVLPPERGETVTAFGYANTTRRRLADASVRLRLDPRTTTGIVQEVHHLFRDRAFLSFPCFRTNAQFDPGMSGGPVFNRANEICGVVCSSLPPGAEEEEHASYASLIWPAFGIRFNDRTRKPEPRFLRSAAEDGRMQVRNLDYVTIEAGTGGDRMHFGSPAAPSP